MTLAITDEVERAGANAASVHHSSDEAGLVAGATVANASAFDDQ
jgi:hypothetical protein